MPERLLDLDTPWFNVKLPLRAVKLSELAQFEISKEDLDGLFRRAQTLIDEATAKARGSKSGWYMNQFQSKGTSADRIASAAVKLSETDCVLHFDAFTLLFDVARADAHHFDAALKALAAVWPKVMPARPLKRFAAQYFATLPEEPEKRDKVVCYWYIEDMIKRTYAQFVAIAEGSLKDNLLVRRQAWLSVVGGLLNSIAESRPMLIAMVVGKLGDPTKGVAHQAYHILLEMLSESSTNQRQLLTELEKLAFTRNCPLAAQKYCVNVMNQLVFSKNERKLALQAVASYLALFKRQVMEGQAEHSLTSAIIIGLRRAFPFAGADLTSLDEHIDALFVLANTGPFLQRVSALAMIQQLVTKGWHALESRFYRALYALLLVSPGTLPHSSQLTVFFSTVYKAMREDSNEARVVAFAHRIVQRCLFHTDAFVCAALLLVAEVAKAVPQVRVSLSQAKSTDGPYKHAARDPQYADASGTALWTLNALQRHTHPSVVKLAVTILMGGDVAYDIHPLDDMTLMNFLSMFADVDPAEALRGTDVKGVTVFRRQVHVATLPHASDRAFVESAPENVDVSHLFMHRYAHQRQRFLARKKQTASTWTDVAAQDAEHLASVASLFGPQLGAAEPVSAAEPVPHRAGEPPEFEADVDGLSWGGDSASDVSHAEGVPDMDAADDFDAVLKASGPSRKKVRQEQWLDRQERASRNVHRGRK